MPKFAMHYTQQFRWFKGFKTISFEGKLSLSMDKCWDCLLSTCHLTFGSHPAQYSLMDIDSTTKSSAQSSPLIYPSASTWMFVRHLYLNMHKTKFWSFSGSHPKPADVWSSSSGCLATSNSILLVTQKQIKPQKTNNPLHKKKKSTIFNYFDLFLSDLKFHQ